MDATSGSRQERVAIIGTGLAGLTTAHLLHNDARKRFTVTLLEQADALSFDSASVAVKSYKTGTIERIDLPMRASAGGYYANLNRMYRHLGVPMHPVRFLFVFAVAMKQAKAYGSNHSAQEASASPSAAAAAVPGGYFIHASNHHQMPPPWPSSYGLWRYMVEVLYLIICHTWFTVACFLVRPSSSTPESFAQYLDRIWLPRRYITHYILPLMSSICTCTHAQLLAFPASDLINYVKLSHNQHHYTVCGGVRQVQSRLARGIKDVRVRSRVLQVVPQPATNTVLVRWQDAAISPSTATTAEVREEIFDRVVLAVSPDVAGRLFQPLQPALDKIPTVWVESSVLVPSHTTTTSSSAPTHSLANETACLDQQAACMHHNHHHHQPHHAEETGPAQVITFRTQFAGTEPRSEARHTMPSGVVVSTCALDAGGEGERKGALKTAGFTRTLRTVESRAVVERIMGRGGSTAGGGWVNGQDNVWLAGAWCWDGMVLLEGCVVSAMRVADDLGAEVPWRDA